MDRNEGFALSYKWWREHKDGLGITTKSNGRLYSHVEIYDAAGRPALFFPKTGKRVPLRPFLFSLNRNARNRRATGKRTSTRGAAD